MKNCENTLRVSFESLSRNESLARSLASAFIAQLDPTVAELADIKCAVSEAVTNCTVHAYPDRIGKIFLTVRLLADRSLRIEVRDSGVGIPDVAAAREPLFTTDTDGERSGMGFTVMESFCDRVTVRSAPGAGTTVTLIKKLAPKQKFTRG